MTHSLSRSALLVAVALLAPPAAAQAFSPEQRLLLTEGTLRGSPRLMGIAGAFAGLAEGAEGIPRNPASAAMKHVNFDGDFHYDFAFTFHFLPPWAVQEQDWDNDGRSDQPTPARLSDFLGVQVIYAFASVQYKDAALGLGVDVQNFLDRTRVEGDPVEQYHNVSFAHLYGTLAGSFWRDQILVGVGVESTHVFINYGEQAPGAFLPDLKDSMGFHGWGVQLGAVYRPANDDWRVGVSWKPQVDAGPFVARESIGGKVAPAAVAVPGRLSLGGALALGRGRHLNIISPGGWVPRDDDVATPKGTQPKLTTGMMKWLFTAQLDVFFPVQRSALVGAFLQQPDVPAEGAGYHVSLQPHLGIEKEVFLDLLRLRLGSYLEPPMTASGPVARPHLTFGFELALFKLGNERISFGISFDIARMYLNLSFGFLVWK